MSTVADKKSHTRTGARLSQTDLHPPTGPRPLSAARRRTATTRSHPTPRKLDPKDDPAAERWLEQRHPRQTKISRLSATTAGTTREGRWEPTAVARCPDLDTRTSSQDRAGAQAVLHEHTSKFLIGSPQTTQTGIQTPLTLVSLPPWLRLPLIVEPKPRASSPNHVRSRNRRPLELAATMERPGAVSTCLTTTFAPAPTCLTTTIDLPLCRPRTEPRAAVSPSQHLRSPGGDDRHSTCSGLSLDSASTASPATRARPLSTARNSRH